MSDAAHAPADPIRLAEIELDRSVTMAAAAAQALAAAKEAHERGRGSEDEENLRQALIHAIMGNAAAAMRVRRLRLVLHEAKLDGGLPVEHRHFPVPAATAVPAHRASDEVEPSQDDDADDDSPPTAAQEAAMALNLCATLDPAFRTKADDEFERLTEIEGLTHDEAVIRMLPLAAERIKVGFRDRRGSRVTSAEEFDAAFDRWEEKQR